MSKVTIDNIEKALPYIDKINSFANKLEWVEPVFITAIKAHKMINNDNSSTENTYIDNMLKNTYNNIKTYSPIEHIHSRGENIETTAEHIANVMLKNYTHLSENDRKDLYELSDDYNTQYVLAKNHKEALLLWKYEQEDIENDLMECNNNDNENVEKKNEHDNPDNYLEDGGEVDNHIIITT